MERAVGLLGDRHNHKVLDFLRKAHRLGNIDPFAELADRHRATGLGSLLREVVAPMMSKYEVGGVVPHLAQHERVRNVSHQRPQRAIHGNAPVLRLGGLADYLVDLLEVAGLDFRLKLRRNRELIIQCLAQQMIHRSAEIRGDGRLGIEARPEGNEPLVKLQIVRRIEGARRQRFQTISGVEMVLDPLIQHAPLVLQKGLRRLAVLRRQVAGILREPLPGEDVLQDHK